MFDLNTAIKHWRRAMGDQPNFRDSDLDELEDHLREGLDVLKAGGLSEEEAFLISSRRLGKPEDLSGEFAIADPERRRSFRLSWMITGALALAFLWLAANVLTNFGGLAMSRFPSGNIFTSDPNGLVWMGGLIRFAVLVLGGILVWRILATDRTSRRLKRINGGTVIGISLLLALLALITGARSIMLLLPIILLVGLWRLVKS